MGIGKQAKILNAKQQTMVLAYLENTRYPLRNKIMFLLSFKAGLRAKEIFAWGFAELYCYIALETFYNLRNNYQ